MDNATDVDFMTREELAEVIFKRPGDAIILLTAESATEAEKFAGTVILTNMQDEYGPLDIPTFLRDLADYCERGDANGKPWEFVEW